MIKSDYHLHTKFSIDAVSSMEEMIKKSVELGLNEIAITDHVDYLPGGKPFPYEINYDHYLKTFNSLKEKYSGKIRLVFGVEIGMSPPAATVIKKLTAAYPFEFIIGSTHDVGGIELYAHGFFTGKKKKTAYETYFKEVLENVRTINDFSVYGHLDYVNRYSNYPDNTVYYKDYGDLIDEILRELIVRGKGLELNTSGFRYGLNQTHPKLEILKRYRELGGEIITVGSDSHNTRDITADFDKAEAILRKAGFTAYTVFRNRTPKWIDL